MRRNENPIVEHLIDDLSMVQTGDDPQSKQLERVYGKPYRYAFNTLKPVKGRKKQSK
jgi:hypothetical protein